MQTIRIGTIGSGKIVHSVLDQLVRMPNITVTAAYSRSADKAAALAACYGAEHTFTDLADFLASDSFNTCYIATPNGLHFPQAKAALLAGKHVICEKPFVATLRQAEELFAIAEQRGLMLLEAMPTAFLPNLELVRRHLDTIGPVRLVMCNYSQYSSRYQQLLAGELTNIFDPALAGGTLPDINYYNISLNIALFGSPREAVYYPNLYDGKYDTSGICILRYDGFVSQCAGAKDTWGDCYVQIEGENGHIYVRGGSNGMPHVTVTTGTEKLELSDQPEPERLYYEAQGISRIFGEEDHAALAAHRQLTLAAVAVTEQARKTAGIFYPEDAC